jgi:hypothetical protein
MVVVRDDRNKFASMFTGIATVIGLHFEREKSLLDVTCPNSGTLLVAL